MADRLWGPSSLRVLLGYWSLGLLSALGGGTKRDAGAQPARTIDPAYKRVLMYLLVGSKGGYNRLQMIRLLRDEPMNANRIGERLNLDYKTIQHHLRILVENNVIVANAPGSYGAMYFLTPYLEKNIEVIDEMWARLGKR